MRGEFSGQANSSLVTYLRHELPGRTLQPTALIHEAYLTQFCAGDDELRREVESLLAQDDYSTKDYGAFIV